MRFLAFVISLLAMVANFLAAIFVGGWPFWWAAIAFAALVGIGLRDLAQKGHSLRRNYPILANLRFLLEYVRPEIRQYFLESDLDGHPFNRSKRAVVYARSKGQLQTRPFGTQQDVYANGYEWMTHSIVPAKVSSHDIRITVGNKHCAQPYSLSLLNISAMSFGALSGNAIRALNKGAKLGGFAHDTGEGSFSIHHREFGGDIIWEIGSGYFGCRNDDGTFSADRFTKTAAEPQIKMIEIKLSQGAKPGHGGVLPGSKVTEEIAQARGVPMGRDCISPAHHSAFSTPRELLQFVARLRELSFGKPIGFKLCIGHPNEFMAICKAMLETKILPDFIVVDGKEGGTGAAPLEFADHLGTPLREGLTFAHNCLKGVGLRDQVRIGVSGRIVTAFDMARVLALGADWCNSARGFMFALGCVQSLSCHTDHCPTGIATQNKLRQRALVVTDKAERVKRFHASTLEALAELLAAAGATTPRGIARDQLMQRGPQGDVRSFAEIYPELRDGALLSAQAPEWYTQRWDLADPTTFHRATA